MADQDQPVLMVDNRLLPAKVPTSKFFRKNNLSWFLLEENRDYFPEEILEIRYEELTAYKKATDALYQIYTEAARHIISNRLLKQVGMPVQMAELLDYSLDNELENHIIGRFDFGGGLDGLPIKLIEFNADTCSLMPETYWVQDWQYKTFAKRNRKARQANQLIDRMANQLKALLARYPQKAPSLLLTGVGSEEDRLNLDVVGIAAEKAGFTDVLQVDLEKVIFSPNEGLFVEVRPEEFLQFDFWFKMVPWDFMIYEEPDLLEDVSKIVLNEKAVVLNPAITALFQCKGIMKYMHDLHPNHAHLLPTSFSSKSFPDLRYVEKPIFGRTGENINMYNGSPSPVARQGGDYGNLPVIYQALAEMNQDEDGDIYQPSVFWSGMGSALCFRRHDEWIVNDEAEYLSHVIL